MQKEIWKDVVDYEGFYQVSNQARVRSLDRLSNSKNGSKRKKRGRILKQTMRGEYLSCVLCVNGNNKRYSAHRLKAIAFIPNPKNKRTVNHRDGIKTNNGYHADGDDNLEWATHSENEIHAYKIGLKIEITSTLRLYGKLNHKSKPVVMYSKNNLIIRDYESAGLASMHTGIVRQSISKACNSKIKTAGGFIWKFKK